MVRVPRTDHVLIHKYFLVFLVLVLQPPTSLLELVADVTPQ